MTERLKLEIALETLRFARDTIKRTHCDPTLGNESDYNNWTDIAMRKLFYAINDQCIALSDELQQMESEG